MPTQTLAVIVAITGIASNVIMWGVMIWKVGRWTASTEAAVQHIGTELQRLERVSATKSDVEDLIRVEKSVSDARDRWHAAVQNFSQQVTSMALGQAAIAPQLENMGRRLTNIEAILQYGDRRALVRSPESKEDDR